MKKTNLYFLVIVIFFLAGSVFLAGPVYAAADTMNNEAAVSVSLVNQDPDPAIAGDIVTIRLSLVNIGGLPIDNYIVEFVPTYPFELVPGQSAIQKVGVLEAYQGQYGGASQIIKYNLMVNKDATAGSYELKILEYQEGSNVKAQKSLTIDIKNRDSAEVIHIDKTSLVPGKQNSLKFTINNVGNAPLRDLTFYWENEDNIILPVGSDNTKYVKYIEVGEGADLEYQVIADSNADPGLYKLNLYLTYEDSITKTEKKISTIAGVYVGGGTDFDVAFSESTSGIISFTIANVGSNPSFSVSVVIPEQRAWGVTGPNSVIIGNLNKGDYTVASFKLQSIGSSLNFQNRTRNPADTQGSIAPRQMNNSSANNLLMQIAYTDTMGERRVVEKEVKFSPQVLSTTADSQLTSISGRRGVQQQNVFLKYKWYFIGIILIAGSFVAYRKYRKEKLLNPSFRLRDLFKRKKK